MTDIIILPGIGIEKTPEEIILNLINQYNSFEFKPATRVNLLHINAIYGTLYDYVSFYNAWDFIAQQKLNVYDWYTPPSRAAWVEECRNCQGSGRVRYESDTFVKMCNRCEGKGYLTK